VEITRAGEQRAKSADDKKAAHDTARRLDAFEALKAGMVAGAYDAARRFERDYLTRQGRGSTGRPLSERVDCSRGRIDVMVQAGMRVDEITARIPPRDFWLLTELIAPPVERGTWRDHVAYVTGIFEPMPQGETVKDTCERLLHAYMEIERRAAA
jgi:hypothetical protein